MNRGLPLASWNLYTLENDKGGLGLTDVHTKGFVLATKWIVRGLQDYGY